jgi:hypothetical protein
MESAPGLLVTLWMQGSFFGVAGRAAGRVLVAPVLKIKS